MDHHSRVVRRVSSAGLATASVPVPWMHDTDAVLGHMDLEISGLWIIRVAKMLHRETAPARSHEAVEAQPRDRIEAERPHLPHGSALRVWARGRCLADDLHADIVGRRVVDHPENA